MTIVKRIPVTTTDSIVLLNFTQKSIAIRYVSVKHGGWKKSDCENVSLTKSLALVITKLHASLTSALNCN